MFKFLIKRLSQSIVVLFILSIVWFMLLQAMPGDELSEYIMKYNPTKEELDNYKRLKGYDKPLYIQYLTQIKRIITGDLGISDRHKIPVTDLLAIRIPVTLSLTVPVFLLTLLIAIPLGIFTAVYQYSKFDYITNFLIFIGISVPTFWIGLLSIYAFSLKLQIFPASGIKTINVSSIFDQMRYFVLPIFVLSIHGIGSWVRYFRGSLLEVLRLDYIRTARAKGLSEDSVIFKHGVRNALIPLLTLVALSIPYLFSGALVTEEIFGIPGMGQLLLDAIKNRDSNLALPAFLFLSFLTMTFNFLADILYSIVDPRIRKSEG